MSWKAAGGPLEPGLYFVGVPIGAARDITLRALDVLAAADILAAEDTRALRRLLEIHGVSLNGRRILTLHDHSGPGAIKTLLAAIADGRSVAYASEAGMPLIADPGYELSKAAADAGALVTCAPGPSALLTALTLAGLPTDAFHFAGFLPSSGSARRKALLSLKEIPGTLILYESPKRLAACLKDAADVLGETRKAAVCRELTKKFEETRRACLADLAEQYASETVKGEIVLLIDRGTITEIHPNLVSDMLIDALKTMSVRDAAASVADLTGLKKRDLYQQALAINKSQNLG